MKFTRFSYQSEVCTGVISNEVIKEIEGDIFDRWTYTGRELSFNEIKLLAPLQPNHIIGIGANYLTKKEDVRPSIPKIPIFFFKPSSSVIGSDEEIIIPVGIDQVKFESELAVVIGKDAKNLAEEEVLDYIFGYTVANDVTAPQFFHENGHWTIGKAFDTFTPLGPFLETELDPYQCRIQARVNQIEKQNSATELMIIPMTTMISYLSNVMTLKKGDVILTGSPVGAEFVGAGDLIECEIEEIGVLRNPIVSATK